jgi:hypothetical protein
MPIVPTDDLNFFRLAWAFKLLTSKYTEPSNCQYNVETSIWPHRMIKGKPITQRSKQQFYMIEHHSAHTYISISTYTPLLATAHTKPNNCQSLKHAEL